MKKENDELTLMRNMAKKLDGLDELTRKRVLDWICSRTYSKTTNMPDPKQIDIFGAS